MKHAGKLCYITHYIHGIFMPYLVMSPRFLAQIRKLSVPKAKRSEVCVSREIFQFASEIHLETIVKRHNLNSETNLKVIKML